jgi:SAM-dependent methyltransferase
MSLDVVDLRAFYASPLGIVASRILSARVRARWENVVGASLLGLGYATPYLAEFRHDAMRTLAMMPAEQGVVPWPGHGEPSSSALVEELKLPLPSSSIDRVLLVHMLEMTEQPAEMLREVWRVLDPGGRLLLIVPSRRGWWAGAEWTPFGHGRPYSKAQLMRLLRETLFSPLDWGEALHMFPSNRRTLVRSALVLERVGRYLSLPFAGVHIVEASKDVFSAVPARRATRLAAQLKPILVPAPVVEPRRGPEPPTG